MSIVKKKKTKTAKSNNENVADRLGKEYTETKEFIQQYNDELGRTKSAIFNEAEKQGHINPDNENQTVVEGNNYEVGYTRVSPSYKPDVELVKKSLPKKVLGKVIKQIETVDETELQNLIELGEVDADILDKVMVQKSSESKRVLVKRK